MLIHENFISNKNRYTQRLFFATDYKFKHTSQNRRLFCCDFHTPPLLNF